MPYITKTQLEERYGERMLIQLTDRAQPATGARDDTVLDRAIADADAVIDGYLMARYDLPLASVPALLVDLSGAIAIYKLHRAVVPDKIRMDHDDAMKRLADIATGRIRLSVGGVEPESGTAGEVRTNAPERPFTTETLKGYI